MEPRDTGESTASARLNRGLIFVVIELAVFTNKYARSRDVSIGEVVLAAPFEPLNTQCLDRHNLAESLGRIVPDDRVDPFVFAWIPLVNEVIVHQVTAERDFAIGQQGQTIHGPPNWGAVIPLPVGQKERNHVAGIHTGRDLWKAAPQAQKSLVSIPQDLVIHSQPMGLCLGYGVKGRKPKARHVQAISEFKRLV